MKNVYLIIIFFASMFLSCDPTPGYIYEDWDVNEDGLVDEEEFYTAYDEIGYYDRWDLDNDGWLDEEEWRIGLTESYPDYKYQDDELFEDWDLNSDDQLDEDEFITGAYSLWDYNEDGSIDEPEYDRNYVD